MRVVLKSIAVLALTAAMATGCARSGADGGGPGDTTRVVAGFYPLAYAAEEIGGPAVEVVNLTPAEAEPHDVELTVRDVERVRSADLVLYLGAGFQPALEDAAAATGGRAVDLLEDLRLRAGREEDEDGGLDPHVWLDPLRYAQMVERIGAELGRPQAAAELRERLEELDRELEDGLGRCERRELVTSHAAFGYLAERYGLEQIAIAGLSPEAEPSPRELERVTALARARGVETIYFETLVSPAVARTVAREVGAETAVLNPIEGLTAEEAERGEDYFSLARANLRALREGLGCR